MNRYSESQTKSAYRSPVYNVRAVPVEKVVANSYNPNVVAPPEMKLLELSIWEDGYTMPCVCYYDAERDRYELVDGYHRYLVLKTSKRIYERERGLLPVAVIEKDLSNRMASSYNPNVVAPPEMKLLELSIWEDGYTMPCVCYYDAERDRYELVDGYHRYLVLKTSKRIYERERGPRMV